MKTRLRYLVVGAALLGVAAWPFAGTDLPPACTVERVEYGAIREVVSAPGQVQPTQTLAVPTELMGQVTRLFVAPNQLVREGDPLLSLDDRPARDRLEQARLALELARAALRQAEANLKSATGACEHQRQRSPEVRHPSELEQAETQVEVARAGVETARLNVRAAERAVRQAERGLSLTTVRVPFLAADPPGRPDTGALAEEGDTPPTRRSFRVLKCNVSLNQLVGPPASAQLFLLASDPARMRVALQVAEGDVGKIVPGQRAEFTVTGSAGEVRFRGWVEEEVRFAPTGGSGAVFYEAFVEVKNRRDPDTGEWLLRPGLSVSADVTRREHDPVWKLPTAALGVRPDDRLLTRAARERLAARPAGLGGWQPVWVRGPDSRPRPVFVRLGDRAIQDAQYTEVLEWDARGIARPAPGDPCTYPEVITRLPEPAKRGRFGLASIEF